MCRTLVLLCCENRWVARAHTFFDPTRTGPLPTTSYNPSHLTVLQSLSPHRTIESGTRLVAGLVNSSRIHPLSGFSRVDFAVHAWRGKFSPSLLPPQVILVFSALTWLLVGSSTEEFSSLDRAWASVTRVSLGEGENFYPQILAAQPTVGPVVVVIYQVLGIVLLLNVVIAILLEVSWSRW